MHRAGSQLLSAGWDHSTAVSAVLCSCVCMHQCNHSRAFRTDIYGKGLDSQALQEAQQRAVRQPGHLPVWQVGQGTKELQEPAA